MKTDKNFNHSQGRTSKQYEDSMRTFVYCMIVIGIVLVLSFILS